MGSSYKVQTFLMVLEARKSKVKRLASGKRLLAVSSHRGMWK
jgi:hypothetical protein